MKKQPQIAGAEPKGGDVVIVALTREQFREEMILAVAQALDAQQPRSEWTDIEGLGVHLGVSQPTIRKLLDDGMPCVFVGAHRRFSRRRVDAWLEERGKPESAPVDETAAGRRRVSPVTPAKKTR